MGEGDCFSLILKGDQHRCQICVYVERILQADPKMDRRSFPLYQVVPEEKRMRVGNQYHKNLLHTDFPNLTSTRPLPSMFFWKRSLKTMRRRQVTTTSKPLNGIFSILHYINCSLERMIKFEMPYY